MPHVVLDDAPDLAAAVAALEPTVVRNGGEILKIIDLFMSRSGHSALVDCVAIENGHSQAFFVQLAQKERQLTVRLLPATDPEKTPAVKRLMGLIAKRIQERIAGSHFGKTNLQEFLS